MTVNDFRLAADFIRNNLNVDDTPDELDRLKFANALVLHTKRKARRRLLGATAAITLTAILGVVTTTSLRTEPLTYRVGESSQKGMVGSYVSAPSSSSVNIRFSEGSDIVLAPSSRGRIAQTTSKGATVVLEDGHASANIVHRHSTQWQILAGPYVVGVTGTSFDVAFHVATQTFELDMRSGSVRVTGPGLKEPIEIRDQQRLTLSSASRASTSFVPTPDVELQHTNEGTPPATASSVSCPTNVSLPAVNVPRVRPVVGSSNTESRSTDQESFTQLSAAGKYARIVELAETDGISTVTSRARASELMALGNAARYVGKSNTAMKAYRAIRERYARSSEAAPAAFFLGRLAENGDSTNAMTWYERYLSESPNGVWAADAMGRRLVLLNQQQGKEASLNAAKEYLERFPAGPYAGFARKLLSL
jgi:TolA-binding protein